nr:universal stress protein [uncultured Sphingomonas sp.]
MNSNVLVPVDLEEPSSWSKAGPTAVALARDFDARLTFPALVEDRIAALEAQWSSVGYRDLLSRSDARLRLFANGICEGLRAETKVVGGGISGGILDLTAQVAADLIVLASLRPAMRDWLIGANAARVVRQARCSVMVVRH